MIFKIVEEINEQLVNGYKIILMIDSDMISEDPDFYIPKKISLDEIKRSAQSPFELDYHWVVLDTMASVIPKIINKEFSIKIEKQDELKEGERTFNDALIYEFLKDVSNAQAADSKEKDTNLKGTDDNKYSDAFLKYLDFRDGTVKERWFGASYNDVMSGFGILDYITDYVNVIQNVFCHFILLSAASLIDDYQTYLDNELDFVASYSDILNSVSFMGFLVWQLTLMVSNDSTIIFCNIIINVCVVLLMDF
jgi:hypothetical protein